MIFNAFEGTMLKRRFPLTISCVGIQFKINNYQIFANKGTSCQIVKKKLWGYRNFTNLIIIWKTTWLFEKTVSKVSLICMEIIP